MSETLEHLQKRARELASSGKFSGWRSVAFELRFEPDLQEVLSGFTVQLLKTPFSGFTDQKRKMNSTAFVTRLGTAHGILKLPEPVVPCG